MNIRTGAYAAAALLAQLGSGVAAQDPHAHHAHAASPSVGYVPADLLRRPAPLRDGIGRIHDPVTTASADAHQFYNQGLAHLHSYAFIEAARSFEQALRLDTQIALAWVGLSRTYSNLFDPAAAAAALAQAQALRAGVTAREQRRIDVRAAQMDAAAHPADATRHAAYRLALDEALRSDADDAELWLLRGTAEEPHAAGWGGQLGGGAAIQYFERALSLVPDHFAAHHYLVHAYENIGRFDQAVYHGEIYARLSPAVAHAQHMLAHDLMKVGRVADAVRLLARADSLEHAYYEEEGVPRDLDWHHPHNQMLLALSWRHQGRLADAERILQAVESMTPTMPIMEAWYRKDRPDLLLAQGRPAEAMAAAQALIDGSTPLAHVLGNALAAHAGMARGRMPEARLHLDAVDAALLRLAPAHDFVADLVSLDARLAMVRGEYLLRSGDAAAASPLLNDVIRLSRAATGPDPWIEALFRLEAIARLARETGHADLAMGAAAAMMAHDSTYGGSHYAAALAAASPGESAFVLHRLRDALRLWGEADAGHPDVRELRRRLQEPSATRLEGGSPEALNPLSPSGN